MVIDGSHRTVSSHCSVLLLFTSRWLFHIVRRPLFSGFLLDISLLPHSCSLFSLLPTLSPVVYLDDTNTTSVIKADTKGCQTAIFSLLHAHTISHHTLDFTNFCINISVLCKHTKNKNFVVGFILPRLPLVGSVAIIGCCMNRIVCNCVRAGNRSYAAAGDIAHYCNTMLLTVVITRMVIMRYMMRMVMRFMMSHRMGSVASSPSPGILVVHLEEWVCQALTSLRSCLLGAGKSKRFHFRYHDVQFVG